MAQGKGKAAAYPGGLTRDVEVPKASPSVNLNPWSADLEKAFTDNLDNMRDMGVENLEQARATLRSLSRTSSGRPQSPPGRNATTLQDQWGRTVTPAGTLKTPNSRSWSVEEEQHLIEVVNECVALGLSGEPMWRVAHPKLVARGVNRPMGGMKMRWCRGLRDETKIDERRKKNDTKMLTALQGPRVPKGQRKSKGTEATTANTSESSPIRTSTSTTTPNLPTEGTTAVRRSGRLNSNVDEEMGDAPGDSPDNCAIDQSIKKDLAKGIRRRGRSL